MNFNIEGHNCEITPAQIVQAMAAFNNGDCSTYYQNFLTNPQFTQAVEHDRHHYPPKCLIHHVTRIPSSDFNTYTAVDILKQLGFSVVDKPNTGVNPPVEESSRTPESNPKPGSNGQKQGSGWTLDTVQKVLGVMATAVAIISGIVALIWKSK